MAGIDVTSGQIFQGQIIFRFGPVIAKFQSEASGELDNGIADWLRLRNENIGIVVNPTLNGED